MLDRDSQTGQSNTNEWYCADTKSESLVSTRLYRGTAHGRGTGVEYEALVHEMLSLLTSKLQVNSNSDADYDQFFV